VSRLRLRTSLCAAGALAGALALGALLPASVAAGPRAVGEQLRGAEGPVASLELDARVPLDGGATVYRYSQERGGIPVEGSEAIVLADGDEGARLVSDGTEAAVKRPGEPALKRRRAIAIAIGAAGARSLSARPQADLVIDPEHGDALAWKVALPSQRPLAAFEVLVDAGSGAVLSRRDLAWRGTSGQALLFEPNAVVANGGYRKSDGGTFNLRDRGDRDSAALSALRAPVILERLNQNKPCLKGSYAEARLGKRGRKVCRRSRNWSRFTRRWGRFEALMAYHHVDQAQEYLVALGAPAVDDGRQRVVANSTTQDNSFYLPGLDVIELGTGGVDDGEDGDVIVHEYGHAIQDAQRPGFGSGVEAGAIGEGFGDYLAGAVSQELWGTSGEFSACVMEWDATSYDDNFTYPPGICLRRTDTERTLGQQRDFCEDSGQGRDEIHCVGEAWSGVLWELREQLGDDGTGRSVVDRALLQSQPMYTQGQGFTGAAQKLILADETLYPGGNEDHCSEIRAEMVARGFLGAGFDCPPA
jgi:hypothetical protein